ncbi:hypothetical protein C8R47DRAFT_1217763 [Mycena vitilis]|nr:hypothetical protein C8R47DRAFT_1217763 [Mycena vitilis]
MAAPSKTFRLADAVAPSSSLSVAAHPPSLASPRADAFVSVDLPRDCVVICNAGHSSPHWWYWATGVPGAHGRIPPRALAIPPSRGLRRRMLDGQSR